jgi:hypothetical protein
MNQINLNITKEEDELIYKIVSRVVNESPYPIDEFNLTMDLTAVHCNGCPLFLEGLLNADDFNFAHDVYGIVENINRDTGKLENCFLPRYAAKKGE